MTGPAGLVSAQAPFPFFDGFENPAGRQSRCRSEDFARGSMVAKISGAGMSRG